MKLTARFPKSTRVDNRVILRQAMDMAQRLLKLAGLNWQVLDFSTVDRRQKYLSVTIGAQPTTTGLHLLVDSTGIKMLGKGE